MSMAIEARSVSKRYPNGAVGLRDVSVSVDSGKLIGLTGPSGSGKTTFFRLCTGAIHPTAGELEVLGIAVPRVRGRSLRRLRARVGMVYQAHNLVGSMSVFRNVLIGRLGRMPLPVAIKAMGLPSKRDQWSVYQLLDDLGIADKLLTRVDDLSGGQRQRVAIARALIQEPELLLADEPVASVDPETAAAILGLLERTCRERGMTVVVSLHQAQYVERYCDRLIQLFRGTLVGDFAIGTDRVPSLAEVGSR